MHEIGMVYSQTKDIPYIFYRPAHLFFFEKISNFPTRSY